MKFRDGMWLTAADKAVSYAEHIYTVKETAAHGLELLCPTKQIRDRGDTLNCPTLTINLEAAFDGVISLEVVHWKGDLQPGPHFELYPDGKPEVNPELEWKDDGAVTLRSGGLGVSVGADRRNFSLAFTDGEGREVTSLGFRSVGFAMTPPPGNMKATGDMRGFEHFVFAQTDLAVGESVHGLGERFGAWNKVGQSVRVWNEDGGTSSDLAYKNIPFWLSSRGYGIFIDTPDAVDLEIGSERCSRVQASVSGQRLKWYLIHGPTPKEVLTKYAILTGRAPVPPAWSFGLWLTTSFTTEYDEATVSGFLEGMTERGIPVEVFHYDCFWMRAFHWCDFEWDTQAFPAPAESIARLKASGLTRKVCAWINPYLGQASPVFTHAAQNGYLLKRTDGSIWQWDLWQAGMGLIDVTNPAACEWYVGCLRKLFDAGVDCLKTDFGERIPHEGVAWHDGSDPARMHNYYAFAYNALVYRALDAHAPGQAVLFARTATTGTQRFPLVWGGDSESTMAGLAESLRGGLSLGLGGFSFWSMDIGGFEGRPPAWIYKRWVATGLFCSHSRLHGSGSYRVPWLIEEGEGGESATGVLRTFTRVKRSLMPYILAQAVEGALKGWPVSVRAVALEFPHDPGAWSVDREFMLGDALLVAPVYTEGGEVDVYLPEGKWTSWWDGRTVVGPRWLKEKHGFGTLPLYVREGTVLLVGAEEGEGGFGYDWVGEGGEIRLYHTKPGDRASVVDAGGKEVGEVVVGEDGGVGEHFLVRRRR
ncbi:hypothetical protein EJ06DRAFT_541243 [Trichodelitschia bisporula]|uniref:alpha-D-xyloside xylohydrolase n=1 Tax=Trichodelitschia bisporula TaxID=703511 RepID=A0A6G1I5K8_9PEZI|nr:hypothetical protein EJ06DRAFT_541243 [Trichodelitschia bisporula]